MQPSVQVNVVAGCTESTHCHSISDLGDSKHVVETVIIFFYTCSSTRPCEHRIIKHPPFGLIEENNMKIQISRQGTNGREKKGEEKKGGAGARGGLSKPTLLSKVPVSYEH